MEEIKDLAILEKAAGYIAKSGLFGVKSPDQAMALMLVAKSEGRNPFEAARDYHIIQGRPTLKAETMLARFQQAGGTVKWLKSTDTEAVAEFSHPQGGSLTITWTIDRAQKAGLANKDNWKSYPAQMLRARCVSEGVRAVFPGACAGMYTPEEVQDMAPEKPAEEAEIRFADEPEKPEPPKAERTEMVLTPQPELVNDIEKLKLEAKEFIRTKPVAPERQKELWAQSGHDWAAFIEALKAEPEPIF